MDKLVKAFFAAVIATALAYMLNMVINYKEDASFTYWAITFVAILVGAFLGLLISAKRKSNAKKEAQKEATEDEV